MKNPEEKFMSGIQKLFEDYMNDLRSRSIKRGLAAVRNKELLIQSLRPRPRKELYGTDN